MITKDRIYTILSEHGDNKQPREGMVLDDLGLDSLDHLELVMAFEEEMAVEIPDADADRYFSYGSSVDQLVEYLTSKNP